MEETGEAVAASAAGTAQEEPPSRQRRNASTAALRAARRESVAHWIALAALLFFLWYVREVLPPFIIAGVMAYILSPLADWLAERTNVRRGLAGLLVFLLVLALLGLAGWLLGANLAREFRALQLDSPNIVGSLVQNVTGGSTVDLFGQQFSPTDLTARITGAMDGPLANSRNALRAAQIAVDTVLKLLLCLLALAYLLVDGQRVGPFGLRFVPAEHRDEVERIGAEIHHVLGRYISGQFGLIVLVSVFTFLALQLLFHLPHALPIAIATGILEVIPLVGPVIAAAIACAVGFTQGGAAEAGWLALFYFVLRQAEDQLVMPLVVGHAVHVHPLVTIFAVVVGEHVAGVLGMVLGVPFAAAAKVVLDYVYPDPQAEANPIEAAHTARHRPHLKQKRAAEAAAQHALATAKREAAPRP